MSKDSLLPKPIWTGSHHTYLYNAGRYGSWNARDVTAPVVCYFAKEGWAWWRPCPTDSKHEPDWAGAMETRAGGWITRRLGLGHIDMPRSRMLLYQFRGSTGIHYVTRRLSELLFFVRSPTAF